MASSQGPAKSSGSLSDLIIGNTCDEFVYLAQGCSPRMVADKYAACIVGLSPDAVRKFNGVCLISAASNRRVVEEVLQRPAFAEVARFIQSNWMIRKELNNSALNMIGHVLLTTSAVDNNPLADAFRQRLCGVSIWQADLKNSKLSEAQKKILSEKIASVTAEDAFQAGAIIADAAIKAVTSGSAPISIAPMHMEVDSRKRKSAHIPETVIGSEPSLVPAAELISVPLDQLTSEIQAIVEEIRALEIKLSEASGTTKVKIEEALIGKKKQLHEAVMKIYGTPIHITAPSDQA